MKNRDSAVEHIRNHVDYPATAKDLVEACNKLEEFSEEDKKWFREHLPEGVYNSPAEVFEELGWEER